MCSCKIKFYSFFIPSPENLYTQELKIFEQVLKFM